MAWRYINPGYVYLLDKDAQATATQYTGYEYSKTGVGFYHTSESNGISLPDFQKGDDFWAKFDCYIKTSSNASITIYIPHAYNFGLYIVMSNKFTVNVWWGRSSNKQIIDKSWNDASLYGIRKEAINSMLVHVKHDVDGVYLVELTINDKKHTASGSMAVPYDSTPDYAVITNYNTNPISNIIISNEEINIQEQIVALPVSATETSMTAQDNGFYLADGVGQTLLQSVNVSSLINEYGSDLNVTGIALVGNPAYRSGEQLSSLTAISKRGGTVTEHGTSNLSEDTETAIWQGFSTASDTTIADLQNMQFGWKAGE